MERGSLTRVSKDFFTTIDGELSLSKGDYFLIYDIIDKHWYYGESRERRGKFPSNHLYKVDIPETQETEDIYVSIAAFRGEQAGDLSFGEGELIVGGHLVEENWLFGSIEPRQGIFPISHVWHLNPSILKKPSLRKSVRKRARVKTSLSAQLDEELDLREGEIVTVLEILEDGWARGVKENGKEGTFPEAFVSYMSETEMSESTKENYSSVGSGQNSGSGFMPNSVMQGGPIYKDFGEACSSNVLDEPAPNYYDLFPKASPRDLKPKIPVDYLQSSKEVSQSPPDDNLNPLGVEPYAITLFPFKAQFPNELSFAEGEVVHLVKHLDSEWAEGTIDEARGYFPISYVNVIVNCADSNEETTSRNSPEIGTRPQNCLKIGASMKVDYTFDAQMDGDLSVVEGEIVEVVEIANDDWVNVRNSRGALGLCPRAYLNAEIPVVSDTESNLLEDFVVMRNDKKDFEETAKVDEGPKRLSEPHRPAPPAPAPGRLPLLKQSINDKIDPPESSNDSEISNTICPVTPTEKQKRADKRQNVISELVITEKEYVRDLKMTYEIFNLHNPCILESRGIDVATLFGNLLEVIQVAEELLDLVLRAMKGCDEDYQTIAPCFLKMADKLRSTYEKYCGNHEAALYLLKKYEENRDIMKIFDEGIETLRRQVVCFDMSSILIKPVQRILKYPLMLHELIKCTEEDHPDRKGIEEARKAMTQVATHINEYKRRKDLVSKYFDEDNTLMRKMSKFTMHSVAKKSSRLSAKLSASLGLTNLSADPQFEELERQFKVLEKSTWQLSKDIEQCLKFLDDEAMCGEILANLLAQYYTGTRDNEVKRYGETRAKIRSNHVEKLKACIERRVNVPIKSLITLLEGPAVLITKRSDKLLDYDNAISRSDKNKESRIAQEELNSAKTNFEALNQQLLEELPILLDAATSILANCIAAFANARKLLSGRTIELYFSLATSVTQFSLHDIHGSFLNNHSLVWNQINQNTFMEGSSSRITESRIEFCPQDEKQRSTLRSKYPPDRLYVTKENIASTSSHDLSACIGTLVAVIQKKDPMGDPRRWFVDNGSLQGFMPARGLKRQLPTKDSAPLSLDVVDSQPDLMSLDSPEKVLPRSTSLNSQTNWYLNVASGNNETVANSNLDLFNKPQRYENVVPENVEFYYGAYDYHQDGNDSTLSITKGQALKLIKKHDEEGNEEWWLMRNRDGKEGYVPSNYLEKI
ncbi:dynamin-binding protein-like [Venturia canescens]|uniref:dynamin-binding protein-like n=1 Tax=Venturia canescens TaxID=32260 RepID=UPI001C9CB6C1|nr:dynamin-binding protein-like [Venturia canescens]